MLYIEFLFLFVFLFINLVIIMFLFIMILFVIFYYKLIDLFGVVQMGLKEIVFQQGDDKCLQQLRFFRERELIGYKEGGFVMDVGYIDKQVEKFYDILFNFLVKY